VKKFAVALILCMAFATAAAATDANTAASARAKFDYIQNNGRQGHPNSKPTILSEAEINAYLASSYVHLPAGVESVTLEGEAGVITGRARVDFDRIREGAHSSNPLLSIFSGVHDVVVVAHAHGEKATGYVHVDSVSLDGIEVPRFVLQLFVEKFLQPKYPQLGLDSQFRLPDHIDSAAIGQHTLSVIQK
jgi:hypothetical protein